MWYAIVGEIKNDMKITLYFPAPFTRVISLSFSSKDFFMIYLCFECETSHMV